VRLSPGLIWRSSRTQSSGLSLPRTTVAFSPPSQLAESTRSFSNSSNTTQGPTAVSATMRSVAEAENPISPIPVGGREVSMA
jgi:hypothetical protein